jgi:hypothetical protein
MRPLLFHHLLSQHPILPTPESSWRLFQVQCRFCCLRHAWQARLSLFPFRVNMSVLQVSLYVTGYCFASLSQGVTTLQHNQSPDCIGCLLSGSLTFTGTGLSPVSRWWFIRTHHALLGSLPADQNLCLKRQHRKLDWILHVTLLFTKTQKLYANQNACWKNGLCQSKPQTNQNKNFGKPDITKRQQRQRNRDNFTNSIDQNFC